MIFYFNKLIIALYDIVLFHWLVSNDGTMWHYFRTKIADSAQPRKHSVVARPLSGWGLHTILYTVMNTWYAGCHSVWLISFLICCSQPLLIFMGIFRRSQHFWTSNMAIGRKLLGKKTNLTHVDSSGRGLQAHHKLGVWSDLPSRDSYSIFINLQSDLFLLKFHITFKDQFGINFSKLAINSLQKIYMYN